MQTAQIPYVLVADDDEDDQEMFSEYFLKAIPEVRIEFVNNGMKVIDFLENHMGNLPCVLLLDFKMPVLNGDEVLQAIQKDGNLNRIYKIVWSTSDNPRYIDACMRHGANSYFKKPSTEAELDKLIGYITEIYRVRSKA